MHTPTQACHVLNNIQDNSVLFHSAFWRIWILYRLNFFKLEVVKIKLAFADCSQVLCMSSVGFALYSKLPRPSWRMCGI